MAVGHKSQSLTQEIWLINSMNTFQMLNPIGTLDFCVNKTKSSPSGSLPFSWR